MQSSKPSCVFTSLPLHFFTQDIHKKSSNLIRGPWGKIKVNKYNSWAEYDVISETLIGFECSLEIALRWV